MDTIVYVDGYNTFILPDFTALHPGYIYKKMGLTVYQCSLPPLLKIQ